MTNQSGVVYLITSYKLPRQVLRLVSTLRAGSGDASIVVHHDDRHSQLDRPAFEALGVRLVAPPSTVAWGDFSQLAMVLRCLKWALAHVDFDWLVLLSGQDYPVRSVSAIEQSLARAEFDAFIGTAPCDRPPLRRGVEEFGFRYHYRWRRLPRALAGPVGRIAAKGLPFVGSRVMPTGTWVAVRALRSPFGASLACHSGSDWFTLSRRAVEAIDRFDQRRPEVLTYYRRTLIPTESFVHTVLANEDTLRLSGDTRRYVVFDAQHRAQPRVLRAQDLESIFASGADFARKFDETVDSHVLDEIDRRVHPTALAITS